MSLGGASCYLTVDCSASLNSTPFFNCENALWRRFDNNEPGLIRAWEVPRSRVVDLHEQSAEFDRLANGRILETAAELSGDRVDFQCQPITVGRRYCHVAIRINGHALDEVARQVAPAQG